MADVILLFGHIVNDKEDMAWLRGTCWDAGGPCPAIPRKAKKISIPLARPVERGGAYASSSDDLQAEGNFDGYREWLYGDLGQVPFITFYVQSRVVHG